MCKRIILIFLILLTVCTVTGCGEHYPNVQVITSLTDSIREITIGEPYTYIGFDLENTDGGKDLILHFKECEE